MKKILPSILLACALAFAQDILTTVAVLPSEGTVLEQDELTVLTENVRAAALKVLPTKDFTILDQNVVMKRLGGVDEYFKECSSENFCIVDLGKKAEADYVAQADVRKVGDKLYISVKLYKVSTGGSVSVFNNGGVGVENVEQLFSVVTKRVPAEVFGKIPGALVGSRVSSPIVASGISSVESIGGGFEVNYEKSYLAHISTEPVGAVLSFNGVPIASCNKTPCKAELPEGNISIVAALEQYETADTTVYIKQNNQSIAMALKPNFGVLKIKPAYSDDIGASKDWSLAINSKYYSSFENRFSPGNYDVKLSHECYEDIIFKAGINKGSYEVFDMASHLNLKTGGLKLSAEADGVPVSEPVFVNGKQVGETPFSGTVPICAKIEIGTIREVVDVKIEYKVSKKFKHQMNKEEMEQKRVKELITKLNERHRETAQNAWQKSFSIGMGLQVMMNHIDSNYSSLGWQAVSTRLEFFKLNVPLRFGLNFDFGGPEYSVAFLKRINEDVDNSAASSIVTTGAFIRLYPADAFYLSVGVNYGYFGGGKGRFNGEVIAETDGSSTAVFPVGAGLILGSDGGSFLGGGFILEAVYNIALLKNSIGGYLSFIIGGKW